MRCFVAAFVQAESARRLHDAAVACLDEDLVRAPGARPVPLANYHVTLKFLGPIAPAAMRRALEAVDGLDGRETAAEAGVVAGFPRLRSARLAAAVLRPHDALQAWWHALQQTLGVEHRRFRAHVTVLRFRRPCALAPRNLPEPVPLLLGPPTLYRSDPAGPGVAYRPVEPAT